MRPTVGFIPLGADIYDPKEIEKVREDCLKTVRKSSVRLIEMTSEVVVNTADAAIISERVRKENVDLLLILYCSWAGEGIIHFISNELPHVPLLLWAVTKPPDMVSPCGLISAASNFKKSGRNFQYILEETEQESLRKIETAATVSLVKKRLASAKIGIIGYPPYGMIDVTFSEGELAGLGPGLVHIDTLELLSRYEGVPDEKSRDLISRIVKRAGEVNVSKDELLESSRMYLALKSLVKSFDLSAIGVRCWPELREVRKLPVCLGLSMLSDEGIVGFCEDDVNKAIVQLIFQWLSGSPAFLGDPAEIDFAENTILLWHCGAAGMKLAKNAKDVRLESNVFSRKGVCVSFPIREGPATIASLAGPFKGGFSILACKGRVLAGTGQTGNHAKIKFKLPLRKVLDAMIENGMGHHLVVCPGDVTGELIELSKLIGLHQVL
jgi:L-fucose isomerase-like protein